MPTIYIKVEGLKSILDDISILFITYCGMKYLHKMLFFAISEHILFIIQLNNYAED